MTEQEVIDAVLAQIPPTKRPAHVSDREFVEIYLSLRRGVKAKREGGPALVLRWSDVKAKLGIEE